MHEPLLELDGSGASPSTPASWFVTGAGRAGGGTSPSSCCALAPTFIESNSAELGAWRFNGRDAWRFNPSPSLAGYAFVDIAGEAAAGALARRAATHRAARTCCARPGPGGGERSQSAPTGVAKRPVCDFAA